MNKAGMLPLKCMYFRRLHEPSIAEQAMIHLTQSAACIALYDAAMYTVALLCMLHFVAGAIPCFHPKFMIYMNFMKYSGFNETQQCSKIHWCLYAVFN